MAWIIVPPAIFNADGTNAVEKRLNNTNIGDIVRFRTNLNPYLILALEDRWIERPDYRIRALHARVQRIRWPGMLDGQRNWVDLQRLYATTVPKSWLRWPDG